MEACNCEHIVHFDHDVNDLPEWEHIEREGHPYLEVREVGGKALWLGDICASCATGNHH